MPYLETAASIISSILLQHDGPKTPLHNRETETPAAQGTAFVRPWVQTASEPSSRGSNWAWHEASLWQDQSWATYALDTVQA